jgi:primosomal protein N' (replication factor Y)
MAVAVALPVHGTYAYRIPPHLAPDAQPGKRVLVPFGNRTVTGFLIGPADDGETAGRQIKPIKEILDETPVFPVSMIDFFQWIASYYMHPLGQVISTAIPAGLNLYDIAMVSPNGDGPEELSPSPECSPLDSHILQALGSGTMSVRQLRKTVSQEVSWSVLHRLAGQGRIRIDRQMTARSTRPKTERWVAATAKDAGTEGLSPQRRSILSQLQAQGEMRLAALTRQYPTAPAMARAMQATGLVRIYAKRIYRNPFGDPIDPDTPPVLTAEQSRAVEDLQPLLGRGYHTALLCGITGSGKTEVYLRLARAALDQELKVLVLVPEIALITQTEHRFRARFGETVAVLHSGLSRGERYDQWLRITHGHAHIAIGARSCVFAPFDRVGLIIVDEEHDDSYKQDGGLNYHARDLAVVRARANGALAILGSATPSVQSWHNVTIGKYRSVHLTRRVNAHPLPSIQTVDLSENRDRKGIDRYITSQLRQAMADTLNDGQQALIFLNRRGFAAFPTCSHCGQSVRCQNCDISLTLHKHDNALRCHYCGFSKAAATTCAACGADAIRLLGVGTEKIQEAVQSLFPQAQVARMDRDTMTRKGAVIRLLKDLRHRRIDILVGTQMVAKGHDFPGITLVGVVCADQSLNFPDFRSGERTFQLLAQVAGRAGRGDRPGKVILQTFNPDHFSILAAKNQDFESFFRREIDYRRALAYPPFTRMVGLRISGPSSRQTADFASHMGTTCQSLLAANRAYRECIQVLGPIEAPIPRIANRYRWQILLKGPDAAALHRFTRECTLGGGRSTGRQGIRMSVDVDPIYLM